MWLLSKHKSTLASIGVLASLHPKSHVFSKRAYFLWEKSTLCSLCATSILRKYLGLPMFFVTKWHLRYFFVSTRSVELLPISRISSMYTARITKPYLVCEQRQSDMVTTMEINARGGDTKLFKSCPWTLLESIYFLPETTYFILPLSNIPRRLLSIYTSYKSPYKKAFLTSSWNKGHDRLISRENKIMMEFNRWAEQLAHRSKYNLWQWVWPYSDPPNHLGDTLRCKPNDNRQQHLWVQRPTPMFLEK